MVLQELDLIRTLAAISLLIFFTHMFGSLFEKLNQPRVVGEVSGGIVLGPSLFGWILPSGHAFIFLDSEVVQIILGSLHQFGLMFLCFVQGLK